MARTSINFLVMLSAFITATSVPSWAETANYPQTQPPMCQKIGQICATYGPYSCCQGLQCFTPRKDGASLCLPLPDLVKPVPSESTQCQQFADICAPYGEYDCCEGYDCVLSPILAGAGVCAPKLVKEIVNIVPLIDAILNGEQRKCQEKLQVCQSYGPYTCCKEHKCLLHEDASAGVCSPIS